MPHEVRAALVAVFILATAVWIGGFVAIVVVARVASRTLGPAERVSFFRALGRSYGVVGTVALAVALGIGTSLVYDRTWDGLFIATVVVAAARVATLAAGVGQARYMTRLRREALSDPGDASLAARVCARARGAAVLRGVIGVLTLVLLALGALLAT